MASRVQSTIICSHSRDNKHTVCISEGNVYSFGVQHTGALGHQESIPS